LKSQIRIRSKVDRIGWYQTPFVVPVANIWCAGREGQRVDQLGVDALRKSDPDRPSRSGQERSRSDSYIQQIEHSKTIMNMKQEGPFLGKPTIFGSVSAYSWILLTLQYFLDWFQKQKKRKLIRFLC
jgi:hypothetical protein